MGKRREWLAIILKILLFSLILLTIIGQLGTGNQESYCIPQLIELPLQLSVKKLICGPDSSVIITHKLSVFATGSNKYNKLCLDPDDANDLPILSDRLSDLTETSMIMSTVFKALPDTVITTPIAPPTTNSAHIDKVLMFQHCPSVLLQDIADASVSYNHAAFINSKYYN